MGLDALLKRFHVLIVGALVAIAAWLQAAGIGQLIGSSIAVTDAAPSVARPAARLASSKVRAGRNAEPILSRNPFDSVTGPLDGSNTPVSGFEPPPPPSSQDPYEDPPCSGIKSSLISAADDPEWSFASLTGSDGKAQLRRKGDEVGSAKVHHIGWFPDAQKAESVPRVWMMDGSSRCIVEMGAGAKEAATKAPVASTSKSDKSSKASALTESINSKIRKVGENSYVVERSAVDEIIKNYAQLAGSLRTRQTKDGMRMSGIRSNSVLNTIGMKNGDVLKSINGFDMNDPDKAVEAYGRLRSVKSLTVTVDRGGSPLTIDLAIQ
jgi:general secretion pathway protein C